MPMSPRLLRPRASGAFDPRTIANIANWYDADDASTMTLNGSTVSEWRSKVSGGVALAQATANAQPTLSQSSINGKPSLLFDGGDFLSGAQSIPLRDNVVFAVIRQNASSDNFERSWALYPSSGNDFNNAQAALLEFRGPTILSNHRLRVASNNLNSAFIATGLQPLSVATAILSASKIQLRISGTEYTAAAGTASQTASGIVVGAGYESGAVGSRRAQMNMCEFIRYSRELTATEIAAVERYLGAKWGITVT